MRIVSYNIWFSELQRAERLTSLVATIISQTPEPDILCFQEVIPETLEQLRTFLAASYPYIIPEKLETTYGIAIFSKHKIIEHISLPLKSRMGRELLIAKIQYHNRRILIANAHFESEFAIDLPNEYKLHQYAVVEESLNLVHSPESVIVLCADTNLIQSEDSIYFNNPDWKDCWTELGSPEDKKYTYDSGTNPYLKRWKEKYYSRLDRINVKGKCTVRSFELLYGIDGLPIPSDHYGVMTDIDLSS